MARRKTRSKKRISRFTVAGVIIFCSITCGILVYNGSVLMDQEKEYEKQITQLKKEKKEADKRAEELKEYEEYVNTKEYIEQVAKTKLGLVYENEIVFKENSPKD